MDMFVLGAVAVLAAMAGFWAGRSLTWQLAEAEGIHAENAADDDEKTAQSLPDPEERGERSRGRRRKNAKTLAPGREIASPISGQVSVFEENGKRKLRMLPDQGKIYAPVAGRIRHLYPMGSAMVLQTEFGADILLQAGSHVDEMCSGYYRCRVMEHEVVRKGTLLLEYDPAAIHAEGADPEVILSVENEEELGGLTVTAKSRMKAGEPILYVACGRHSESYEMLP